MNILSYDIKRVQNYTFTTNFTYKIVVDYNDTLYFCTNSLKMSNKYDR